MVKQVSYTAGGGMNFFKAPAGAHPAIIVGVMELGTEMVVFKEGDEPKAVEQIRVLFEIEAEQEKWDSEKKEGTGEFEEKIGIIGANYSAIVSDKSKLGKVINAVYDVKSVKEIKNFSLDELLGKKCSIEVEMKGKNLDYDTIVSVGGFSKKTNYHEQVRDSFYFGMEDPEDFSDVLLEDKEILKPWDMDTIKASPEYKEVCKELGIPLEETLDEQEDNMKAEAEERKVAQEKADNEPTVSSDDAKGIFNDEPETTTIARENAKTKTEAEKEEVTTPAPVAEEPVKKSAFE